MLRRVHIQEEVLEYKISSGDYAEEQDSTLARIDKFALTLRPNSHRALAPSSLHQCVHLMVELRAMQLSN